jgi:hypothetical protein
MLLSGSLVHRPVTDQAVEEKEEIGLKKLD